MAVRMTGTGAQGYASTANVTALSNYTFIAWWATSTATSIFGAVCRLTAGTRHELEVDGAVLRARSGSTTYGQATLSVNAWTACALTWNGSAGTFYRGSNPNSLTVTAAGVVAAPGTISGFAVGSNTTAASTVNGRIAAVKVYTAVLTQDEIVAELQQYAPWRTANLSRWHPFLAADTADYGGTGNTLTGGTGATTEDGPPIPWTTARILTTTVAAAPPAPPVPGTVSYVATSTPAAAGTTTSASAVSITPTLPAGTAAGDRVYVVQAGNNTSGTTPTNWTALAKDVQVGPTGTAEGLGVGRRYLSIYYQDYDGVWTMPAFTLTSRTQNTHALSVITLRKGATDTWDAPAVSTAGNTSAAGTAYSVVTGSLTTTSGMVLVGTATNDNVTASAESLTSAAMTFADLAERSDTGSAQGWDVAIKTYTAAVATGGTGTIAHAATLSTASEGGSIVVAQSSTAAAVVAASPPPIRLVNQAALVRAAYW